MRIRSFACLTFLLAFLATPAWPQASTSIVRGTVRDQTDASIPNAAVSLTSTNTSIASRTRTNEVGFYIFPGVQPGPYRLTVETPGMEKYEATLTVQVQLEVTIDPVLKVGQTTTTEIGRASCRERV